MIQIKNLVKIYKSKKKNNHKALDNINLNLPNSGLIFIIGKSGSGKSTLLNLLGGLDNATSGTVLVDGNDITNYSENELSNYRNNHIGFIFQDYHLLDELTVYENIVLSLNLNKINDNGFVLKALEKVGLSGYENRYPTELSGGERQRVAIARAIVKKPYVILADEPTGNLDNETGTQIISLLKELSKECLILIVSHNTIDTYKYADRIIKLSNGEIISDESRNSKYYENLTYVDDVLYYPMDQLLSNEDITVINEKIKNNTFKKIVGKSDKYIEMDNAVEERSIEINKKNLSIKNIFKLCLTFLKSKLFRISASGFMIAVIIIILALSQTIISFDSEKIIEDELMKSGEDYLLIEKKLTEEMVSQLGYNCVVEVEEKDKEKFIEAVGDEEIYPLYSLTLPIKSSTNYSGKKVNVYSQNIYLNETLGTLIVDEDFLLKKLGDIKFSAEAEQILPTGIYITDYVADSIIKNNSNYYNKTHKDLVGQYTISSWTFGYINGIIQTNYRDTYMDFLKLVENNKKITISSLYDNQDFINFNRDLYSFLGYCYSFNRNYIDDVTSSNMVEYSWISNLKVNQNKYNPNSYIVLDITDKNKLQDNEVVMNYKKYNEIFGTEYTTETLKDFTPHAITISEYRFYDENCLQPIVEETIYIKRLANCAGVFQCNETLFSNFFKKHTYVKGFYFNGINEVEKVIELADELNFEQKSVLIDGIRTMTKAVDVFVPIFELVAIVLCAGIVFIMISFSTKMIKDKMHDIGILKALGCKNNTVGIVFGLQLLLIAIFTIVLSTFGYLIFIDLANDVLVESLKVLAPSHVVLDLNFLTFKPKIALENSILIIILTIVSFVIPMIRIYRIKPVKIIKTKE